MRILSILLLLLCINCTAMAQWFPGYFYDTKGNKETGLINPYPRGKGPIKGEGFIEFKEDKKAETIKLSASDIKAYVVAQDSFIVAATDRWSNNTIDFVRVALNTDLKLYAAFGQGSSNGGGSGPRFGGSIGTGIGAGGYGGYGGGFGGGISIPIGGSGGGKSSTAIYFFGTNTADMKPIGNQSFIDVMSEVMGDEPEVVEQIRAKKFSLNNIEKLIAYYQAVEQSHKQ